MKKIISLLIAIATILPTWAQTDQDQEKAKKILDALSAEAKTFSTITTDFKLIVKGADVNSVQTGKAQIKGDKFFYETEDRKVFSDGKTVYTYLIEENECYIDNATDLEGGINPKELLTIWEENFKYQYSKAVTEHIHEIKMYPTTKSRYHTVILTVDDTKNRVNKIVIKTNDNVLIQFSLTTLVPNLDVSDDTFVWNKNKYKGVEEIDNR